MGGISSRWATSFITLILQKPCWRWPRSSSGITAAFLYCDGYRESTSSMMASFCALNLNGRLGLLTSVFRCCSTSEPCSSRGRSCGGVATHHHEGVAPPRRCGAQRPPLGPLQLTQGPGHASKDERSQFCGHCGCSRVEESVGDGDECGGAYRRRAAGRSSADRPISSRHY